MSHNKTNIYDVEPHITEVYDQQETFAEDVELLRNLIGNRGPLRILEPFCGTGRILIPLASDGHSLVGLDQARGLLDRAQKKTTQLPDKLRHGITLIEADVITDEWPKDFDLVILGGNCFYELASSEEQEGCVASAAAALSPGGHAYIDNDHMEGDLDESWRRSGVGTRVFPSGICADGTRVSATVETIWFDAPRRVWRARRTVTLTFPGGRTTTKEWEQQKHPVSKGEVETWLHQNGFEIEHVFGDRAGNPYEPASPRAIFWARRT